VNVGGGRINPTTLTLESMPFREGFYDQLIDRAKD